MTISEIFDNLVTEIEQLKSELKTGGFPYWSNQPEAGFSYILNSLSDYWYQDGRDGRETTTYYAAVAVDDACLVRLEKINQLKLDLKQEFAMIRKGSELQLEAVKHSLTTRNPTLAKKMEQQGLARLHIKQLTRMIPLLPKAPELLSYNWYQSGRSIQKVTKQQVLKRLLKLDHSSAAFQIQYQTLASIAENEPLAIVQQQAPLMRLNIKYADNVRTAQNISMPIFFLKNDNFPRVTAPPVKHPSIRVRKKRSDNRLEDSALLPSLRVFRYQQS